MKFNLFFVCFFLSTLLHYIIQKIFIYFKYFDDINFRSSHKTIATRTGGIGIFFTLFIISSYYYFNQIDIFDYTLFIPIGIMFVVGVYDDFYNADFKLKFLLQIIVAKILIDQGFLISNYHGLFGIHEVPRIIAQLTTIFVFLIIVIAYNFIDGIDGLAIIEFIKIVFIIEYFALENTPLKIFSYITILSILPLFYFNFKKENKIFLGDSGSLLLGTVISVYTFYILGDNYILNPIYLKNKTFFSILILLYPLIDLLRIFIIRLKNNKSPFEPDQNHIHHILYKKGYSSIKNILIIQFFYACVFCFLFFGI